jgi:phosphatidylinositol alpha-mannosyltransferase
MRIALVHPLYWPEVHRGSERIVHDIGAGLARRGHEVVLLTTHPGRSAARSEDGMRVIRRRRAPRPPGAGLHELFLETVPRTALDLRRGSFDVAHAFHLSSAVAAVAARRLGGPPVVYSFHGVATRTYLVARRHRASMLRWAIAGSAATTALSAAAAASFRHHLFIDPLVLPAGLDLGAFAPAGSRREAPTLLCAASFTDPRKRVPLLLEAFAELRSSVPEARLVLADNPDPSIAGARPELPAGAEWADLHAPGALAEAYTSAWATVLPSEHEAQGMVVLESLACGTPVVAARSGAPPEILGDSGEIGLLFEPGDRAGLAGALRGGLDLGAAPQTAGACRSRAEDFSWERLLPEHEALYDAVVEESR